MRALFVLVLSAACCFAQPSQLLRQAIATQAGWKNATTAAAAYTYHAVLFDGSIPNRLDKASSFTGNASGTQMTASFWVKFDTATDGAQVEIFHNNGGDIFLRRTTGNLFEVLLWDRITMRNTTQLTASSGWHHILCAVDTASAAHCKVYVDGVDETSIVSGPVAGSFNFNQPSWGMFNTATSKGRLCEFWCAFNQFIDITVAGNRTKFSTTSGTLGKPISLGSDGSLPTGTAPIVYLPNAYGAVNVNQGTGGNFTLNGTPADSDSDMP